MEGLVDMSFWKNRKVLVTGHTGFKGGWLSVWLEHMGADVCGYALDAPTSPSFFVECRLGKRMRSVIGDICNLDLLRQTVCEFRPEIVIHMAAQPLVRDSYKDPLRTYTVNVMGTVNVLEAVRSSESVRSVVVVTTDKCYENQEWSWGYRESDRLGGYDPYSSSKACAEMVVSSYRNSFFNPDSPGPHAAALSTARAGNVIGGGDWAADRLIPDCVRAFGKGECVLLRCPGAVRPWQHVLEPLAGYLQLAEHLFSAESRKFTKAWNFGPNTNDDATVGAIAGMSAQLWGEAARVEYVSSADNAHETGSLRLDSTLARTELGWKPRWPLDQALAHTIGWYRAWADGADMESFSLNQILAYEATGQP
jgi:CDP-glucose 4,6-dehydratase